MQIISEKVSVTAKQEKVAKFLRDSKHLIHLLPQDQISDWKASDSDCSFKVQGGVTISLVQDGSEGNEKIFMKSGEKSPFPFKLTIHITEKNEQSEGYIQFDGELNVFLKMMVEKPLTALFNIMSKNLKDHFEKGN
jgi:hypothetical protein